MSDASLQVVVEKLREVGGRLGYSVERGKGRRLILAKGRVVLVVEAAEIAENAVWVEVKVAVDNGGEFEEAHWEGWMAGLEGVAVSWQKDGD